MELRYSKYGIFWQPPEKGVSELIDAWKERVRTVEPLAVYLDHPVHCTFFLVMALENDESKIIATLKNICNSLTVFSVYFSGWGTFDEDAATGGGDTLVMGIEGSESLFHLQQTIAAELSIFKKKNINYPTSWTGQYKESYQRWGFPFVGKHWEPHITIASVKEKGKQIIEEAKQTAMIPSPEILQNLSLVRITEHGHIHLKTFQISSNAD